MKQNLTIRTAWITVIILSLVLTSCEKTSLPNNETGDPVITERGELVGNSVSLVIGPEGGELESSDGRISIAIPPDALTSSTTVTIQAITSKAPQGVGFGYRLMPEGLTFAKPVELVFSYDDQLLSNGGDNFLWIVTQASDGSWNAVLKSEMDRESREVRCSTTHFSDWSLGRFIDLVLEPSSATVDPGKSVQLKLSGFSKETEKEDDELAPLIFVGSDGEGLTPLTPIPAKESRLVSFSVKKWNLNGEAAPVSNLSGTLTGSGTGATYKAPEIIPEGNPVSVSVNLETSDKAGSKSSFLLSSNITITDSEYYVRIKSDDQTLLYYQYGINTTTPFDPDKYGSVLCGIDENGALGIIASFIDSQDGLGKDFGLRLTNPSTGSNALAGSAKSGNDDIWFFPTLTRFITLDYEKRSKEQDGTCETIPSCGEVSVTLEIYTGEFQTEVKGSFSGTIYEDKLEYSGNCKTPDARMIQGEFRLIINDYFMK